MKESVSLVSALSFDRGGRHLIAVEPDAIAVVSLAANETTSIAIGDARA